MELYNYFRSTASYRVRIALNLKNLDYEYKPVHLLNNGGEQKTAEYTKINPMKQVPSLVVDGTIICQSMAIIEFLDESHPRPALFPKDPIQRAKVRQVCEVVNSGIQPLTNLHVMQTLEKQFNFDKDQINLWMSHFFKRGFQALNQLILKTVGRFSVGHNLSAADIFVMAQAFSAERFGLQISEYPVLDRVIKNCLEIEAFQKAHPYRQPDTPEELRI